MADVTASDSIAAGDGDVTVDAPRPDSEAHLNESAQVTPQTGIAASDAAAATDTAAKAVAANPVSASDSIAASDADATIDAPRSAPEATMAETATVTLAQGATEAEQVQETGAQIDTDDGATDIAMGEGANVGAFVPVAAADAGAAADAAQSPSLRTGDQAAAAETSQVSSQASTNQVSVADQVAATEQPAQADQVAQRPAADPVALGEQATGQAAQARAEQAAAAESARVDSGQLLSAAEQAGSTEQSAVTQAMPSTAADTAAVSAEHADIVSIDAPDTPIHITLRMADAGETVYDVGDEAFVDVVFTDADTNQTIAPEDVAATAQRPDRSTVTLTPFPHGDGYRIPCALELGGAWRVRVSCGAPGPSVEQVLLYAR